MSRLTAMVALVVALAGCGRSEETQIRCQDLTQPANALQLATFPDPGEAPTTIDSAFAALDRLLPPARKAQVRCRIQEHKAALLHFSVGRWLRNGWLAPGTKLRRAMAVEGFIHPDDMSAALLKGYAAHLGEQRFDFKKYAEETHVYWRKRGVDVEAARAALLKP